MHFHSSSITRKAGGAVVRWLRHTAALRILIATPGAPGAKLGVAEPVGRAVALDEGRAGVAGAAGVIPVAPAEAVTALRKERRVQGKELDLTGMGV